MDIYAANIMDHYKRPRNYGALEGADAHRHEPNTTCGDEVTVDVKLENEKLVEIGFVGEGCAISQAGASIVFEELIGMSIEEVLELKKNDAADMLGVPLTARRSKCAVLGLLAVQNALLELRGQTKRSFSDVLI